MHISVLLKEVISGLNLKPNQHCLDATIGGGGHAAAILKLTAPRGKLLGLDRDRTALLMAAENLAEFGERFIAVHDSYVNVRDHATELAAVQPLHAILLDLGLSSWQLDEPERGFSFRFDAPLDMRFDQTHGPTAADLLNSWPEEELRMIFREYGEERYSSRIAQAIVARRQDQPWRTTEELVDLIAEVVPAAVLHNQRIHPATRVFQALRIAVNQELVHLQRFLPMAVDLLAPGGRCAVIAFHSLEDRLVKQFFHRAARDCICPPEVPVCRCDHRAILKLVNKKPIIPSAAEIKKNPRGRSARLRIIEKI